MKRKLYVIGAGGTASYLLPVLVRTLKLDGPINELIIIDRDVIEEKNVDRQLYVYSDIGKGKAEVLAESLREYTQIPITAITDWFTSYTNIEPDSFIISCTDNHPARLAALNTCDTYGCQIVICGNETFSADAYFYSPEYAGLLLDPRVRYPAILTDVQDDPTRPPCNDADALEEFPQLAAANSMSANLAMQLIQLWLFEIDNFNLTEVEKFMPIEYSSHKTGLRTLKHAELNKEPDEQIQN